MSKSILMFCLAICFASQAFSNDNAFINGSNNFGMSVFQELAQKEDANANNVLYSPLSMNAALSMVGHFAETNEQNNFLGTLGMPMGMSYDAYNSDVKKALDTLSGTENDRYKVNVANSFWVDKDFQVGQNNSATQNLVSIYGAAINNSLQFAEESTADVMNQWVAEATEDKITQLVTPADLRPNHWASINAVYFNALWFHKLGHGYGPDFTTAQGETVKAQYMEASAGIQTISTPELKVWEIAYGSFDDKKGSMIIFQPTNPADLAKVVQSMDAAMIADTKAKLDEQTELQNTPYVALNIPAFELSYETGMNEIQSLMSAQGSANYFTAFDMVRLHAGLTATQKNRIKVIKQKAVITVANEGTTAAAASFVGGGIESMGPRTEYVDSAFAYVILDEETKAILFVGTLNDPSKAKTPEMN